MISTNPVGTTNEIPVGVAKGTSSATYLLGMNVEGDASASKAIDDAMAGTSADAMSNLVVDQETIYFLFPGLFSAITTRVRGTLIKYIPDPKAGFIRVDRESEKPVLRTRQTIAPGPAYKPRI
jgi:hypothetical protein